MIRHLVALRFDPTVSDAEKAALMEGLKSLRGHLGGILDFQVLTNISPEDPVVHGFRDLFWFDFADTPSRDSYLVDAAHQVMGGKLVAACGGIAGIQVIDVELPTSR
jgi:Stress responsive A/B Barrel Domain